MASSGPTQPIKDQALRRPVRQKRSAQKIEEILAATERHISAHGIINLSTNQTAKNAGVSIGTIYHYFDNKEAILTALYGRSLDRIWNVLVEVDAELGEKPKLRHFAELSRTRIAAAELVETPQMLLSELLRRLPVIQELDMAHSRRVTGWLVGILKRMGSKLPDPQLNKLAMYIITVYNSSTWEAFTALRQVDGEIEGWRDEIVGNLMKKAFLPRGVATNGDSEKARDPS